MRANVSERANSSTPENGMPGEGQSCLKSVVQQFEAVQPLRQSCPNYEIEIREDHPSEQIRKKKSLFAKLFRFFGRKGEKSQRRKNTKQRNDRAYCSDPRFDKDFSDKADEEVTGRLSAPSAILPEEFAINRQWAHLDVRHPICGRPAHPPSFECSTQIDNMV